MIAKQIPIEGSGKGPDGWFEVRQLNVSYDHPYHQPLEHAVNVDFVDEAKGPGARVAIELTLSSARQLVAAIERSWRAPTRAGSKTKRRLSVKKQALLFFEKLQPDAFGPFEKAAFAPIESSALFQYLGAARLDPRDLGGEIVRVHGDVLEPIVLLEFLARNKSRHVKRHPVKIEAERHFAVPVFALRDDFRA
jgi:hypothetical protein